MSSTTMNTEILDRFYGALKRGDVAAARACFTPTALIWHNFDGIARNLEAACKDWERYISNSAERDAVDIRRHPIAGGVVQQYLTVLRTQSGERKAWPVCVVYRMVDGLIDRLDEYIAPKSSFTLGEEDARTPGF